MMDSSYDGEISRLVYIRGINAMTAGGYTLSSDQPRVWRTLGSELTELRSNNNAPCVLAGASAVSIWCRSTPSFVRVISVVVRGLKLHF